LHVKNLKNKCKFTLLLTALLLSTFALSLSFLTHISVAQTEITSVTPITHIGKVGETIQIEGTIETPDGDYRVFFDYQLMVSGTAEDNMVKASFEAPNRTAGNYTIILQDVARNENASTWFMIRTGYGIEPELPPEPLYLRQNSSVVLHVNVTGGQPNTVYHANVSVKLPYPLNKTFSTVVELSNTTDTGYGYANVTYPKDFPSEAHTNFTGLYRIYFNKTQNLAEHGFFIGLTNASKYHREETVEIRAVGYQANETATITIAFAKTNETLYSDTVNATEKGTIYANWPVPWNASIGVYNVTITGENTIKQVKDSQLFSVPGYQIDIYTRNLAGDAVPHVLVEAFDQAANDKFNKTSGSDGLASLLLEKGNHTFEAFWKEVKVGEMNVTISGESEYNFTCELTNMKITVEDGDGNRIPFVYLNISYQYTTTKEGEVRNESLTGETSLSGVFSVNSTLPHISYTINASRYGVVFNTGNNTVANLPAEKWANITIICPAKTLTLNITEHHRKPFANAHVEITEEMGGISYVGTTDNSGKLVVNCTFGKYEISVYAEDILLNQTTVEMFQNKSLEIYCKLYNLTVTVKTVDYFGQPIPKVNVTITREKSHSYSAVTKADGTATFQELIGGTYQINAYLNGQNDPAAATVTYIGEPRTLELKLERHVIIAGMLVETAQLATLIAIILVAIFVAALELYLKRRRKKLSSE